MKECYICKKPLNQAFVEIIPNELYVDFACMADLLPNATTNQDPVEKKIQRQKEIGLIVQNLIDKYKEENNESNKI